MRYFIDDACTKPYVFDKNNLADCEVWTKAVKYEKYDLTIKCRRCGCE